MSEFFTKRKLFFVLSACVLTVCIRHFYLENDVIILKGAVFGSYYQIRIPEKGNASISVPHIQDKISQFFETFNQEFSTYRSDSVISTFNQSEDTQHFFPVSPLMYRALEKSVELHQWSDGYFDVTLQPLLNEWGFNSAPSTSMNAGEIKKRLGGIIWGMNHLEISSQGMRKKTKECQLNMNALGEGFAIDLLKELLNKEKLRHFLIEIGGEIYASGFSDGEGMPWKIGIEEPLYDTGVGETMAGYVELSDKAVATSGNYRHFFNEGENYFGHIIDPLTGFPTQHRTVSVTVISSDCMTADGAATALMAMGQEKGFSKMQLLDHSEAMWLVHMDGKVSVKKTQNFPKMQPFR